MSEKLNLRKVQFEQSWPDSHRLRRYPHNRFMKSEHSMTGDMLRVGNRRTTYFVLLVLLMSSIPLVPSSSADVGIPSELQAQEITATFDNVSETTTISWRNIEQTGGNPDLYSELWTATYHVFRHTAPITSDNIDSLNPWHSVIACDKIALGGSPLSCRGLGGQSPHPGHSATYQVGAGTNGSFFYAVTTELGNGSVTSTLTLNGSSLAEPVVEITTPIRSPYNIVADFDPESSSTSLQWINYNSINPVLPETGNDALQIKLWRTNYKVDRANGENMISTETPIATLSSTNTTYEVSIPPMTNREVFYSVTYFLPNWTEDGSDYEDTRFLSNNAMSNAILEDNTPPTPVDSTEAYYTPLENGTGFTSISWDNILSEEYEEYRIYRHGEYFTSTNDPYAQLIGTIS